MSETIEVTDIPTGYREIGSAVSGANMRHTVTIRDDFGRIIESLMTTGDGHFHTPYGKVHRKDFGEYVLRRMGHSSITT